MAKASNIKNKKTDNFFIRLLKSIRFKSLDNTSLYLLLGILFKGLGNRTFGLRVGAVAWAFFFSLFPFLLFLFSVLPYVPLYFEIKTFIFSEFLPRILPERITNEVIEYISQTAGGKSGRTIGALFILLTILLSSNGITVLINGFNASYHGYANQRKGINNRIISVLLTLFFVIFIITQLIFTYYTNFVWRYIEESKYFMEVPQVLLVLNFVTASFFYFTSLVMLYYFGTNIRQRLRNVAPGALMATALFYVTLLGFQFYVKRLNYYDVLYGSVGLVMVMMVFVYINVLLIMIGFELNATIYYVKNRKIKKQIKSGN